MQLGIKEASQGTYIVLIRPNQVYMTLNYALIFKAPWRQPVIRLIYLLFPLLSLFLPLTRFRHKGAEHTLRLGFLKEPAVSHYQVTESSGNNLHVHTQGKAHKKSHIPIYCLSIVNTTSPKMALLVLKPMIPNLNLTSDLIAVVTFTGNIISVNQSGILWTSMRSSVPGALLSSP